MLDMLIVFIFTRNQDQLSFTEIPPKADVDQGLRNHLAPSAAPERPVNRRQAKARASRARGRGCQAGVVDESLNGKGGKGSGCIADELIHSKGGHRIVLGDIIDGVTPIGLGFRRSDDPHSLDSSACCSRCFRRKTASASTSSFERPRPARLEARAASTLLRRKSSCSRT